MRELSHPAAADGGGFSAARQVEAFHLAVRFSIGQPHAARDFAKSERRGGAAITGRRSA
jgi:hypothetical protein